MLKHHVFVIHGITDGSDVSRDFTELVNRVRKQFHNIHKVDPDDFLEFVPVYWDATARAAERAIFEKCFGKIRPADRALVTTVTNPLEDADLFVDTLLNPPNPLDMLFGRFGRWRDWRYFATL